ncbi:hypothetical protein JAB5_39070 [Janthinobacterium sp. HH103]|uniref:hypothetical protein n=1 Tax=unclassified Janthinobacterium TaxID=2610881 RepID=UPI00087568B1|nr:MULTISPECIES: hypothetical protein [unclassified Janthinobacterium]OEZ67165.1 hypothetical protein JAB2_25480 [Janthinobacterium sp. HH100]OEZ71705.1 hypothetical protein JAB5_39070 [Janthinobacterium sp. HH103]QOU71689.1 hypothetical protein JAB4_011000 [Janthinobacterium sp. HH102]
MFKKIAAFLFAAGTALSFSVQAGGPDCTFVCERNLLDCVEFGQPACMENYQACQKECLRPPHN